MGCLTRNDCCRNECSSGYQFTKIIPNHREQMPRCKVCSKELLMSLIVTRNQNRKLMNVTSMGWCDNGCIAYIFRDVTTEASRHYMLDRSYRNTWLVKEDKL